MKLVFYTAVLFAATAALVPVGAQIVGKAIPGDPLAIDSGLIAGKILPSGA